MKINLELDVTPEEMRRLVGLPDAQPFWDAVQAKILEGDSEVIGQLVKTTVSEGFKSVDLLNRLVSNVNVFKRDEDKSKKKPAPKRAAASSRRKSSSSKSSS